MPNEKIGKTIYECSVCKKEFKIYKNAEKCENTHKDAKLEKFKLYKELDKNSELYSVFYIYEINKKKMQNIYPVV